MPHSPPVLSVPSQPIRHEFKEDREKKFKPDSPRQLALGFAFGIAFGFLLQKGGVAKYEVLMGQFLLTDFTVMKIMMTAIVVGMVGVFSMRAMGLVKLHVKPTNYASNVAGGLMFGVGLGLLGYCPGTGAAALGQGSYDALAGVAGLLAGSYLFAETSDFLGSTIQKIGSRGGIMLPDLLNARLTSFLVIFASTMGFGLMVLERLTG